MMDITSIAFPIPVADDTNEDDYIGEDGLLYCGKCHTPKQCYVPAISDKPMPCLCRCESEARDIAERTAKEERDKMRIERLRASAFPDLTLAFWNFGRDDTKNKQVSTLSKSYVEQFDDMLKAGEGILFYGDVGTGKTFYACCIANALIDNGHPCFVTNFTRLVNELFSCTDKQAYIDDLNRYDLLVIDDFGVERNTEYMNEIVTNVIDARYVAHKPMIITTNLSLKELTTPANLEQKRMYSRLLDMCHPVAVKGDDRRKDNLRERTTEFWKKMGVN